MTEKQPSPEDLAPPAPPRRGWLRRAAWIAGPAILVGVGGWLYVSSGRYASTDNAYVQADRVTVAPQIAGRVVEVAVRENQAVHAGDVLFRIDPEPLRIALDRMEAQIESVRGMLEAARSGYDSATADVRSADADLDYKQQQFQRMKELRARGLVAQAALDGAGNELAAARAKRDANAAAVAKARGMLGGLPGTPNEQLAGYKLALAQLAQARLDLEHATVRAPMDGTIGKTALQPGDFLAIGQAAMPLIGTTVWVDANFKETDLAHVRVGQPADIEVDAYPGRHWKARVASISPASGSEFSLLPAQNATGNWVKIVQRIPVRLAINDPADGGAPLRAGMSSNVAIDTGASNSVLGRWLGDDDSAAHIAGVEASPVQPGAGPAAAP